MQLKKQVNNKIRENIKKTQNGYKYQISIHCVELEKGVFPSSIVLSCQALRGISQLIEGVKRPPSNFPQRHKVVFGWS